MDINVSKRDTQFGRPAPFISFSNPLFWSEVSGFVKSQSRPHAATSYVARAKAHILTIYSRFYDFDEPNAAEYFHQVVCSTSLENLLQDTGSLYFEILESTEEILKKVAQVRIKWGCMSLQEKLVSRLLNNFLDVSHWRNRKLFMLSRALCSMFQKLDAVLSHNGILPMLQVDSINEQLQYFPNIMLVHLRRVTIRKVLLPDLRACEKQLKKVGEEMEMLELLEQKRRFAEVDHDDRDVEQFGLTLCGKLTLYLILITFLFTYSCHLLSRVYSTIYVQSEKLLDRVTLFFPDFFNEY